MNFLTWKKIAASGTWNSACLTSPKYADSQDRDNLLPGNGQKEKDQRNGKKGQRADADKILPPLPGFPFVQKEVGISLILPLA